MEVYIDLYTEQARNEIGTPIYLLAAGLSLGCWDYAEMNPNYNHVSLTLTYEDEVFLQVLYR